VLREVVQRSVEIGTDLHAISRRTGNAPTRTRLRGWRYSVVIDTVARSTRVRIFVAHMCDEDTKLMRKNQTPGSSKRAAESVPARNPKRSQGTQREILFP